jgi:hypothetical protein
MRNLRKIILASLLLLGLGILFWPRNSAQAVLERAITAHGGEANVGRCNVGRIQGKGIEHMEHFGEVSLRWEEAFHLPNRYRRTEWKSMFNRTVTQVTVVKDGVSRFRRDQGEIEQWPVEQEQEHFLMMLRMLTQLRKEAFTLSLLLEGELEGKQVRGIKAVDNGEWRGNLYFDQKTGLLFFTQTQKKDSLDTEVLVETYFLNYRDFDGIPLPMRVISHKSGRKNLDFEITKVEFLQQIDDHEFDMAD